MESVPPSSIGSCCMAIHMAVSQNLPEVTIQVTRRKANRVPLQEPAISNIVSFISYTYHEA